MSEGCVDHIPNWREDCPDCRDLGPPDWPMPDWGKPMRKIATPLPDVAEILEIFDGIVEELRVDSSFPDKYARAALKAKVTELAASRDGWANSWQVCDADRQQLRAALAEAQKNAERYQWLRDTDSTDLYGAVKDSTGIWTESAEQIDAAIDAAIEQTSDQATRA